MFLADLVILAGLASLFGSVVLLDVFAVLGEVDVSLWLGSSGIFGVSGMFGFGFCDIALALLTAYSCAAQRADTASCR